MKDKEGEIWTHKTSLTTPLFIEVPVISQATEPSCIFELGVSIFVSIYDIDICDNFCFLYHEWTF
jgi:hypothetical protein